MNFWTDSKVVEEFSPEDKYFYLYCFTNPHTNLCGCYEISPKQIANEMGYSIESVMILLDRFEDRYNIIRYSKKTKELLLLNWHKYNWTTSDRFRKPLLKEINSIKEKNFRSYLTEIAQNESADTVSIPYPYGIDTTVTDTVSVTDTVNDNNNSLNSSGIERVEGEVVDNISIQRHEIIDYLNEQTGKQFRADSAGNKKYIDGRLNEGYSVEDFKKVIDNKVYEWKGTEQEQYLRPETLFAPSHFESYLNQKKVRKKQASVRDDNFWATVGDNDPEPLGNFLEDWG
jgi:uncharacterized phage protein (TIGR02220 family)